MGKAGRIKKRVRKAAFVIAAAFAAATLVLALTPAANILARPLVVAQKELRPTALIAVLGGGAYPNGSLGGASNERLIRALVLYNKGRSEKILFAGGGASSLSGKLGHTVFGAGTGAMPESAIMMDTALALGLPAAGAAVEAASLNTYENLVAVKAYMDGIGIESVTIVTSPTHMRRAAMVAARLGLDFQSAPVADYTAYRTSATERLCLAREVFWEYAAIALYRLYGYI